MKVLQQIVVRHSKTGQVMTTTNKSFEAIYQAKGFEIVDRDNAGPGTSAAPANIKIPKGEPVSTVGSAADMAARLGLISTPTPDPALGSTTTPKAASQDPATPPTALVAGEPAGKANENDSNASDIDGGDLSDERPAAKRDRRRGSK